MRWIVVAMTWAIAQFAHANRPDATLDEALSRASVVVRGTVARVLDISFDKARMYSFQSVEVEVSACISADTNVCSEAPEKIGLVNPVGSGETHAVALGREYVFLLDLNSYVLFAGSGVESVFPVKDGFVDTDIFEDVPDKIPAADFLALTRARMEGCAEPECP